MGLHAVYVCVSPQSAPKVPSELSFIIPTAASMITDRGKAENGAENTKRPQITEMPTHTGRI